MRRAVLTGHIVVSVGWIGAAAAYLALAVAAAVTRDVTTVRAGWIAMQLTGWWVILPLACLALASGLWLSSGTAWGFVRHYWVLISLVLTVLGIAVMLLHLPGVTAVAATARGADEATATRLGSDVVHPAAGLLVLIIVAVLNVYKPRGLTRYGARRQSEDRDQQTRSPSSAS